MRDSDGGLQIDTQQCTPVRETQYGVIAGVLMVSGDHQ